MKWKNWRRRSTARSRNCQEGNGLPEERAAVIDVPTEVIGAVIHRRHSPFSQFGWDHSISEQIIDKMRRIYES